MTRHKSLMLLTTASAVLLAMPMAQAQQTYSGNQTSTAQDDSHHHRHEGDNGNTTSNTSNSANQGNQSNGGANGSSHGGPPANTGNGSNGPSSNHDDHSSNNGNNNQSGGDNHSNDGHSGDQHGDNTQDRDHHWGDNDQHGGNDRDRRADNGRWDGQQHNGYMWNGRWYFGEPPAAYYGRPGFSPGYHEWRRGDRLPPYFRQRYSQVDYRAHHLRRPPRGYHYVQDDRGDILLVALTTGVILSLILGHH